MKKFAINSNVINAQVYLIDGLNRKLIGVTPITLEKDVFASQQIIVVSNEKEKAIFLDRSQDSYFVDFTIIHNSFNKYGVYLNGSLQYLNINQFDYEIKAGTKIDSVYIDGKHKLISEVPELLNIVNSYSPNQNNDTNETYFDQNIEPPTTNGSAYLLVYIFFGLLISGGLVWYFINNSNKNGTTENFYAVDSSAVVIPDSISVAEDSAATIMDSAVTFEEPSQNIMEQTSEKDALAEIGVSTFNDYTYVKPNYEGCGSYFSLTKTDYNNGNYIFTGMISSYFASTTDDAYVEMLIDGQVEHFSYYESGNNGNYIFLRGNNMTLEIILEETSIAEEAFTYEGKAELTKNGNIRKFRIYGVSGC